MKTNSRLEKIGHELRLYLLYTLFLWIVFSALTFFRKLTLAQYDIPYIHLEYNLFQALILAKVILLGQMLKLGERFGNQPLIIPTVYKTAVFSLFLVAFSVLEEFVMGYFKGKTFNDILHELSSKSSSEIIAKIFIMTIVFIFFFAFIELDKALGKGKLFQLFFKKR